MPGGKAAGAAFARKNLSTLFKAIDPKTNCRTFSFEDFKYVKNPVEKYDDLDAKKTVP